MTYPLVPTYFSEKNHIATPRHGAAINSPIISPPSASTTPTIPASASRTNGNAMYHFVTGVPNG